MAAFQHKSQGQQHSERDLPTPSFSDPFNPHLLHHLNFGKQWNESNQNRKWGFKTGERDDLQQKRKNFREK